MNGCRNVLTNSLVFLGSALVLTSVLSSTAWADQEPDLRYLKLVRLLDLEEHEVLTAVDGEPSWDEGVCIALNPQNGHLYLFNPDTEEIIERTKEGEFVARREVLDLDFTDL